MIKKNDKLILEIMDYGCNGEGVAKVNGQVVFVPFAMVGETVEAIIIFAKKNFYVGKIVKIIKANKNRIVPQCEVFGKCGGCNLQHMNYKESLILKQNIVQNAICHIGKINCEVEMVVPCTNPYNYRNKLAFPVCETNGQSCVCMFKSNTHTGVAINNCYIQEEWAKPLIEVVNSFLSIYKISAYNETTKMGLVRHVVARRVQQQTLICLVLNGSKLPHVEMLIEMLNQKFNNFGLYINVNTEQNNVILSNNFIWQYGIQEINVNEFGLNFPIHINSFMQVNHEIQNKIYEKVLGEITSDDVVINTYSGAGLLSGILSKKCKQVYGIEIVKDAVDNANALAKQNNISNLQNMLGDCAQILPQLIKDKNLTNFTVVLDPPRKGCDKLVIEALQKTMPNKIIYISCDPSTLSRDLKLILSQNNYTINYIQPYDMFPQTKHVETLVCLTKK